MLTLSINKKGFDKMNKERLKDYITKDKIYQDYKQNKLMNPSDFDRFCIQHCKDIGELIEENLELEQALDEIEKYMTNYIKVEDYNENVKVEFNDLLKIMQRAKGDVKNEN